MLAVLVSCTPTDESSESTEPPSPSWLEDSHAALRQAEATLASIPRKDLVFRATRDFIILRQVELSSEALDRVSREQLQDARQRAHETLPKIRPVVPLLRQLQEDLLDLCGAFYRGVNYGNLPATVSNLVGNQRSKLQRLVDELETSISVLEHPSEFTPTNDAYFSPDFDASLTDIRELLPELHPHAIASSVDNPAEDCTP